MRDIIIKRRDCRRRETVEQLKPCPLPPEMFSCPNCNTPIFVLKEDR